MKGNIITKVAMAVVCGSVAIAGGTSKLNAYNENLSEAKAVEIQTVETATVVNNNIELAMASIDGNVEVTTEETQITTDENIVVTGEGIVETIDGVIDLTDEITIEDEEVPEKASISDIYANVAGTYSENIVDEATGIKYNVWVPATGSANKSVIFCVTGISNWANESTGYGPHLLLKNKQVTPDAVIVVIQRKASGAMTNSYSTAKLSTFISDSIINNYHTSKKKVYYYGFSMGGCDWNIFGPLYNWRAAAFADGYNSAMNAATYCKSLKAVMYNNSTGTPSAWNKANADKSAAALGLTEGVNYVWNTLNGSHANINQYSVIQAEGQGHPSFSKKCTWKTNECNGMPQALNWLLQW